MRSQNGGIPKKTCFPTRSPTSWADDHVAITGILGIGRTQTYSLLGDLGSLFMQEAWGYPTFGVCVCTCPSAGHDMIMLDYRECGPDGEPTVVHVDQGRDFAVTFLAEDFETFVRGLVDESEYDESEAELAEALDRIDHGTFSTGLAEALRLAPDPVRTERALRVLLREVATEKGYFALLHATARPVRSSDAFLESYRDLLAFGDGQITTRGYAPGFIEDWMKARRASAKIVERNGTLVLSEAHRRAVADQLARL
ncbi:MAG: SMI1/KNR4 family protein [Myxococcota bacterium]